MLKRVVCVALAAVLALGVIAFLMAKPTEAAEITELKCSDDFIHLLKEMEGFNAVPRWDYSQWTVGFGSACPDEDLERYQKEGIPPDEAHELMMEHLVRFEENVNAFMVRNQIQLTQNQFDTMVSLVYNLGPAILYKTESDVIRSVLYGADTNAFLFAIGQHCSAGGEFLYGLLRRRMMEGYMYLFNTYSTTLPSSFCYVRFDANGGTMDARAQGYDTNFVAVPMSVPTREGYIFAGWYTEATGGQKVSSLDASNNGMVLYAHWEEGSHKPQTPTDSEEGITVTVLEDMLSVRKAASSSGAIVSHVFKGDRITITGVTKKDNTLWGCFRKGWICLEYTDYYELTGTQRPGHYNDAVDIQVPIKMTVLDSAGVEVRSGPHSTYPKVATLKAGKTVVIEEVMIFYNLLWGRYSGGWVRLTQKVLLHDEQKLAHNVTVTVNYARLNVRSGPGMNYSSVTQFTNGTKVEILAIEIVDGIYWGRCTAGWIHLDNYTDFNHSKYQQYKEHSYGNWYTVGQASCSVAGQMRRDCSKCDHYELQDLQTTEHDLGQWYVYKEATCAASGEERRECSRCQYYESKTIDKKEHVLGDWYVSQIATCTASGEERRECSGCDHYESRTLEKVEHVLGDWYVSKIATCVEAGQERRDCANCEHFQTRDTALADHIMGQWSQSVAPGCETVGQELQKCENCDHTLTKEIPAVGHSFGDWFETVAPTQEAEGEARRNCANCQHFETKVLEKVVHVFGQWYVFQEATCAAAGEERRDCSHCELVESRPIPVKEHSFGEWETEAAATCTAVGQEKRSCTACDHVETRELAKLEHSFGEWTTVTAATCVVAGQEKRECTACAASETRETALSDTHEFGQWEIYAPAGCESAGEERRVCVHCQHYESRATEPAGHSFGQWYISENSTCTVKGQERRDCESCDHFEAREIQLAEHSYGAWHIVTAPTIDAEGQRYRECVHCGFAENGSIPTLAAVERVYATITYSSLAVRTDTSTSSAKVGSLLKGIVVQILEQKTVNGKLWGRIEYGWVLLTGHATLKTVREPLEADNGDKIYADITYSSTLNIRSNPSKTATKVAAITAGARVRIYEIVTVDAVQWGRSAFGWIWLTGYATLETIPSEHTEHSFGEWYVSGNGTCVMPTQERRDCVGCDHYETRDGQLGDHSFGQWFDSKQATCVEAGQQQRNCQFCQHFETRDTAVSGSHAYGQWQVITAPSCETAGQQSRTCAHCGHAETQEMAAVGHSFGQWFVSKQATCVEAGQEQRNCQLCDHVETRDTAVSGSHAYGQWQVITAPSCEAAGQQSRTCAHCGRVETQEMKALGHSFGQWYVVKEATEEEEGQQRRDCANCDHHELQQIEKLPPQGEKVYGQFTGSGYLNIREGAGTNYAAVGKLYPNTRVEILEQKTVNGKVWGRIEGGWVMITGYIVLETEGTQPVTKTYGTMTNSKYSGLNVRSDAGYDYEVVGRVAYGETVEILETKTVDGKVWGRIEGGWILITGMVTLETVVE